MTVSKLERGKMQLTLEWAERIAAALGCAANDLVDWEPAKRDLLISGTIEDGHVIVRAEEAEHHVFEDDETFHAATQWFYCHGDELRPFFFDGDALGFRNVFEEDFQHLIGRLAVVTFFLDKESHSDVLVVLAKFLGGKRFNLRTLQGLNINDVEVYDMAIFRGALVRTPEEGEGDAKALKTGLLPKLA